MKELSICAVHDLETKVNSPRLTRCLQELLDQRQTNDEHLTRSLQHDALWIVPLLT
jgi:hypothetical protein